MKLPQSKVPIGLGYVPTGECFERAKKFELQTEETRSTGLSERREILASRGQIWAGKVRC
jgi:hypothetical protein